MKIRKPPADSVVGDRQLSSCILDLAYDRSWVVSGMADPPLIGIQLWLVSVWRNFVGVSVPLAKCVEIVPGYLNQHAFRDGQDRSDHTVNIDLFVTF